MENKLILKIRNKLTELTAVNEAFDTYSQKNRISKKNQNEINLILEEIIVNIISYGFNDKLSHEISISINIKEQNLYICFIDDGIYFDPTKVPSPNKKLSIDEVPVGGLGIHLVKSKIDSMTYTRKNGKNILTLIKKLI